MNLLPTRLHFIPFQFKLINAYKKSSLAVVHPASHTCVCSIAPEERQLKHSNTNNRWSKQ
ncbi:UNVERIFIED_CONTAM: hypothetical protein FKN15_044865 [Acipenser sinensis]